MTVLHMPPTGVWTVDALEALPDDYRYEVREGNLVVMAAAMRPWHADVQRRVCNLLVGWGKPAFSEQGVLLDHGEIRTCDVGVFVEPPTGDQAYWPATAFELVVEIVSASSRREDRDVKPILYAAAGIAAYWRVEEADDGTAVVHQHALVHVLDAPPRYAESRVVTLDALEADASR